MVAVSVKIDEAAVSRLDSLLARIAAECPRRLATETRRAALYLCQAFRSRTKTAPKKIRSTEYAATPSTVPPRYIHSNSKGRQLLRRWALTRKLGTPDAYTKHHYVTTKAHRGKSGRMIGKSQGEEKRELLRFHGGIRRAGLAKKSWGWVAQKVYSGAGMGDLSWKRTHGERRDPRQYINGVFRVLNSGAEALLHNRLDYILAAMPPGALDDAVTAATNRLEHNITKHIERAVA